MAFTADQFFPQMDALNPNEWVDFDQFLDLPSGCDDQSTATTVSPQDLALPYDTNEMFSSPFDTISSSFDMTNYDLPQEFVSMNGGFMQDSATPLFDDAALFGLNQYDNSNTFRDLVEEHAAADPRVTSTKEKRREASIALHLQRLCDATALDLDMSSDSNTSFSSPNWSEYVRESNSPRPSAEKTYVSEAPREAMQMVLDLNMNAAANVPKKQKPRSQAQRENYIKARKYGACEKHKKQHKRCNCLDKPAARVTSSDVPMNTVLQGRPSQHPILPVPILPDARYSSSPGHNPSINSPQALASIKATRKPTKSSRGHDPSVGSPAGLPLAVPIPKDAVNTRSKKSTPPYHSPVYSTEQSSKNTSSGQPRDPCTQTVPKSIHTSRKPAGSTSLRWRVSTSSSLGIVSLESNNTRRAHSTGHSTTGVLCTPGLDVHQTRSSRTAGSSVVPDTVIGNLGIRYATTATPKSRIQIAGKDHKKVSQGIAKQLATLSGLQLVPRHLMQSPSRRGSPTFCGSESPVSGSLGLLVRSVAGPVGVLISSAGSAFAGVWQSLLSLASGPEKVIYKCLSLFGRDMMSAKKALNLNGLRISYSA